jgi:hypothetical protein
MNVLGTPARFAGGLEALHGKDQTNVIQDPIHAIGRAVWNLVDINAGNKDAEQVAKNLQAMIPKIPKSGIGIVDAVTQSHALELLEHFGAQMAQDPVTWVPFYVNGAKAALATEIGRNLIEGAHSVGARIPGLQRAVRIGDTATAAHRETIKHVARKFFTGRPEMNVDLEQRGKTLRLGSEEKQRQIMREELGHSDKALLKSLDKELRNVEAGTKVPEALRQRTLQEAWRYGDERARQEALEHGYNVVEADKPWEAGPEHLIDYPRGLRQDYEYTGDITKKISELPAFASQKARYGQRKGGFEFERKGNANDLETDRRKRWELRLAMGRRMIEKRRIDKETEELLHKYGGWKGHEQVAQGVKDAIDGHAKSLSQAKTDAALFRSNPESARTQAVEAMNRRVKDLTWSVLRVTTAAAKQAMEDLADMHAKIKSVLGKNTQENAQYFAEQAAKRDARADHLAANPPDRNELLKQLTDEHVKDIVSRLSHNPEVALPDTNLRWLSNLGKQGVVASALPHLMNNLGSLMSWRGGIPVVINGIRKMLPHAPGKAMGFLQTGIPDELLGRLKAYGGYHDFDQDFEKMVLGKFPGIHQYLQLSNAFLNRGELALRAALLESLDKEMGYDAADEATEFLKGQIIRETAGDPRNQSAFVSLLEAIGAPFAAFSGTIVHNVGKTLASPHAYRVTMPLRAQQDMDQDPKTFHGLQLMNPAIAAERKLGSGGFAESTVGPIPGMIRDQVLRLAGHPHIQNPWDQAAEFLMDYGGPVLSQVPSLFGIPFHRPGHKAMQPDPMEAGLHFLTGMYHNMNAGKRPNERAMRRSAARAMEP